jgi:EAL domain-containing protein (putative c-di-GMP-specific phosphodiesterase class I)
MQKLSPDSIKVDGSFVRELVGSAGSRSIVKSVIYLSRDLSINVVAEGIETSEQLEFLCRNDCDEGQGHFLGAPKLVNEIGPYLQGTDVAKFSAA